jgi:hypothetical protein
VNHGPLDYIRTKLTTPVPARSGDAIAIVLKTINRKAQLMRGICSIIDHADVPYRLYIADDGDVDAEQMELYAVLQRAGHFVKTYDKPVSLTVALNDLSRATQDEQFILRMDDDFIFCSETRVSVLRDILQLIPAIGAVSGAERQCRQGKPDPGLRHHQGYLLRSGPTLYRLNVHPDSMNYVRIGTVRVAIVGHARNFILIRKEVIQKSPWNEELIFEGEHTDFSLRLAGAGFFIAFTPDCVHEHHDDGIPTQQYTRRDRAPGQAARKRVFREAYGIGLVENVNFRGPTSFKRITRVLDSVRRTLRLQQ